ncbi:MAG: hypothetical protein IT460_16635 [Planctomycetes bacterium]|nr:hypothetical protein [Planctomycetota bacterium]
MNVRRRGRAALAAVAVLVFGTEALHWARHATRDALVASYPFAAIGADLEPVFVRDRWEGGVAQRTVWSADRREVLRTPLPRPDAAVPDLLWIRSPFRRRPPGPDRTWNTPTFFGDPFARRSAGDLLLGLARELRPAASWSWEGGALVARRPSSGDVVAAIGPTGSHASLAALGEDRFGELSFADREEEWTYDPLSHWHVRLVDETRDRLVLVTRASTDNLAQPPPVTVVLQPLVPAPPAPGADVADAVAADELRPVTSAGRVRWVDPEGRVRAEARLDPDERISNTSVVALPRHGPPPVDPLGSAARPLALVVETSPPTGDVFADATRYRLLRLGRPVRRLDLVWVPTGAWQRALETLACVPLALRPLPSAVASSLSAPPARADDAAAWWWRDPTVAGGHRPPALAANVLGALVCAWLARRLGRRHCTTTAGARLCTVVGLLAGPLGLLWLRIAVVRAATDRVGGDRRSLALDASPSSSVPWPPPSPTGAEIVLPAAAPTAG